jgi:hypothetical protein
MYHMLHKTQVVVIQENIYEELQGGLQGDTMSILTKSFHAYVHMNKHCHFIVIWCDSNDYLLI